VEESVDRDRKPLTVAVGRDGDCWPLTGDALGWSRWLTGPDVTPINEIVPMEMQTPLRITAPEPVAAAVHGIGQRMRSTDSVPVAWSAGDERGSGWVLPMMSSVVFMKGETR